MIRFDNLNTFNWGGAILGMRNSYNSWDKSDSFMTEKGFFIGDADLMLMKNLAKAGSGHDKFLRQILISVDITAPNYWWAETDTYHFFETNSTSKMHTLGKTYANAGDFSMEDVEPDLLEAYFSILNEAQRRWYESGKKKPSKEWRQMLQLTADSYNYTRHFTTNYAQLKTMYFQRKNHRLEEWRVDFQKWVESLPYSGLITNSEMGAGYALSSMSK